MAGGQLNAHGVSSNLSVQLDTGALVSLTGNTFTSTDPFYCPPNLVPNLAANTFAPSAQVHVGGTLNSNITWPLIANVTYELDDGYICVASGATLRIASGVYVEGTYYYGGLEVKAAGQLVAKGANLSTPITFDASGIGSVEYCKITKPITINSKSVVSVHWDDFSSGSPPLLVTAGDPTASVNVANNWWGTTDPVDVAAYITDHSDYSSLPPAIYLPVLTAAPTLGPTVGSVSPKFGSPGGGTQVTITGTNLGGATAVKFGAARATIVNDTDGQIVARSPAGAAGAVDITVTTAGGTSPTSSADKFTYGAPAITSVTPNAGPAAGGTIVTITGTDLTGASAVDFGRVPASEFTVNSNTQIVATSPAGAPGTADVTVTTAVGTSSTCSADKFTYIGAPTLASVSPNTGPLARGTQVLIKGTNLTGATAVNFGAAPAVIVSDTDTQIVATSPAGSPGPVNVTVTTAGGTSAASSADKFTYGTVDLSGSVLGATWTLASAVVATAPLIGNASVVVTNVGDIPLPTGQLANISVVARDTTTPASGDTTLATLKNVSLSNLAANGAKSLTFSLPVNWTNGLMADTYQVLIDIIPQNNLAYFATTDNWVSQTAAPVSRTKTIVAGPAVRDLQAGFGAAMKLPANLQSGGGTLITVPVVVTNVGNVAMSATTPKIEIQIFAVDGVPADQTLLKTLTNESVISLGANKFATFSTPVTLPPGMNPGAYNLEVVEDVLNVVTDDSNPANNTFTSSGTLGTITVSEGHVALAGVFGTGTAWTLTPSPVVADTTKLKGAIPVVLSNTGDVAFPTGQLVNITVEARDTTNPTNAPITLATLKNQSVSKLKVGGLSPVTCRPTVAANTLLPADTYQIWEDISPVQALPGVSADNWVARRVERLVESRAAGLSPDLDMIRWTKMAPEWIMERLISFNLLDLSRAAATRSLHRHLADWRAFLDAKGTTEKQIKQQYHRAKAVIDGCNFCLYANISAELDFCHLGTCYAAVLRRSSRIRLNWRGSF
jgi:hypothetical protein